MIAESGHYALVLALGLALIQSVVPLIGARLHDVALMNVARSAALAQLLFVGASFTALVMLHVNSDFSVANVYENSHSMKPLLYKITGVWGNHEGSMLLWVSILALFGGPTWTAFAFWGFVIAAVTDFLDGWLARKYQVESLMGAILDPIADKVLVAGAVVGLAAAGDTVAAVAGGLILFREFSVSALREVLAPRGLRLPVTYLAKWKTTLQLVALAAALLRLTQPHWMTGQVSLGVDIALWAAALVTVWTGIEYGLAARKALKG